MRCPYCNQEMETGSLVTGEASGLFYLPKDEKLKMIFPVKGVEKVGGVVLEGPHWSRLNYTDVPCVICKVCKKIIVSYEN